MSRSSLCDVQPLDSRDPGDDSHLTCAPVVGIKLSDYDCCATEAWILVGLTLDDDSFTVERVEAVRSSYWSKHEWRPDDTEQFGTLADALAYAAILADDYWRGRRCTCP